MKKNITVLCFFSITKMNLYRIAQYHSSGAKVMSDQAIRYN